MLNFQESSRGSWASGSTVDHINAGSLQRIADATEKIAINYDSLLSGKQQAEASRNFWREKAERLDRRVCALRGVITRMKNKHEMKP